MRKFIILGLAGVAVFLWLKWQSEPVLAPSTAPRVFAHYMPWFKREVLPNGQIEWEHWQWYGRGPKHDPDDIRENGQRDIASVFYPMIGPYDSRDPAVLEYHLLTAKAAGIEGFIADWYGPGTYSDEVFGLLTGHAARYGMATAICLEEKAFFPSYSDAATREQAQDVMEAHMRHVLATHGQSIAYWRRDGKAVFYVFVSYQTGPLGSHMFTPDELTAVLDRFADDPVLFVRGHLEEGYQDLRAGYAWCGDEEYRRTFYEKGRALREQGKLDFWSGVASPGFDDSGVYGWGKGARKTERRGTAEYDDNWDEVVDYNPDVVQIVTWNDFEEGTTVEPAKEYGFTFVDLTEQYVERYTGREADLSDNRWPYRLYKLRRTVAGVDDAVVRAEQTARLDSFAGDFSRGKRFLMNLRLKWLEFTINRTRETAEGEEV